MKEKIQLYLLVLYTIDFDMLQEMLPSFHWKHSFRTMQRNNLDLNRVPQKCMNKF